MTTDTTAGGEREEFPNPPDGATLLEKLEFRRRHLKWTRLRLQDDLPDALRPDSEESPADIFLALQDLHCEAHQTRRLIDRTAAALDEFTRD